MWTSLLLQARIFSCEVLHLHLHSTWRLIKASICYENLSVCLRFPTARLSSKPRANAAHSMSRVANHGMYVACSLHE